LFHVTFSSCTLPFSSSVIKHAQPSWLQLQHSVQGKCKNKARSHLIWKPNTRLISKHAATNGCHTAQLRVLPDKMLLFFAVVTLLYSEARPQKPSQKANKNRVSPRDQRWPPLARAWELPHRCLICTSRIDGTAHSAAFTTSLEKAEAAPRQANLCAEHPAGTRSQPTQHGLALGQALGTAL